MHSLLDTSEYRFENTRAVARLREARVLKGLLATEGKNSKRHEGENKD